MSPNRSDEDYVRALRASTLAVSARPGDWGIVNTHGVAQFRNGHFREALATLLRSVELSEEAPGSENLAFVAMSQYQLGRVEEARSSLEQLRDVVRLGSANAESQAFLLETEAMVGGGPGSD